MPIDSPPTPPPTLGRPADKGAPIVDVRGAFGRSSPQTAEDRARSSAFIDGKIEMIRRDPHLTEAQKAAAIADLESRK